MKTKIVNVLIHDGIHPAFQGAVLESNGKIEKVIRDEEMEESDLGEIETYDGQGLHLMPGMIDVHLHGGYGFDFIENPSQSLKASVDRLPHEGCTSFLASLTVIDHDSMIRLLEEYASLPSDMQGEGAGASFLGIHSEGPFLSPEYKALMDPLCLKSPDWREFEEMKKASGGLLKVMTVSPSYPDTARMIRKENQNASPVVFMIGHTAASSAEALDALKVGAAGFTHLFNAMSQFEHRNPGCAAAAFLDDSSLCELIVDGFHVHPDMVRLAWKVLGSERIVLITDAMPGKGMPDGEYLFSKLRCMKKGNTVRVRETGRIAGSAITMLDAIKNMNRFTGASFDELARMSAYNPARIAGVLNCKGSLEAGKDADMVLLNDDFELVQVWSGGRAL